LGHCIVCPSFGHCIVCSSFGHCIVCPSSTHLFFWSLYCRQYNDQ
jgi:hypothetical protein